MCHYSTQRLLPSSTTTKLGHTQMSCMNMSLLLLLLKMQLLHVCLLELALNLVLDNWMIPWKIWIKSDTMFMGSRKNKNLNLI